MTTPSEPRVAFVTLGCPKNEVDSDRMRAAVQASRYELVDDVEGADIVVVNTCSFIRDATEESIETIFDVLVAHDGQGRRVIVAGCMVSRYGADLASTMPEVDDFLPVADEGRLLDVIARLTGRDSGIPDAAPAQRTAPGPSAYLQVSDGCHRTCAYCTIPAIRGPYRSRTPNDIIAEARDLVARGAKELVLIGQDVTSYGIDLPDKVTLATLLTLLTETPGLEWLRIMYAQPDGITEELLRAMAASGRVCHYLDMPLQHASPSVLRRMGRSGDATRYLRLIERIRTVLPAVVLRTTLIAGFPGETRQDVRVLHRFLDDACFDYVGVFAFSPEDGTAAATLSDAVPLRTRRARAQRLRDLADGIGTRRAELRIGDVLDVLVEGIDPDDGTLIGRWRGQAPEIDGIVMLDRGEVGAIVRARIVDTLGYDLEGEVL